MLESTHDDMIPYENPKVEAQRLFSEFHPFSEWMEDLAKKGFFALSAIICAIMALAAINLFAKSEIFTGLLWWAFAVWVALFFAYAIFKVVYDRKRADLFRRRSPRAAADLWN